MARNNNNLIQGGNGMVTRSYYCWPMVFLTFILTAGCSANKSGGPNQKSYAHIDTYTATDPELPRVAVNTAMPAVTGRTITVSSGGDIQAALNQVQLGDQIVLQAGATFTAPS